jgi:large subunit ribosomal protein L24
MQKCHVKKGDEVVVISGTEKGKRVIVEGIQMIKRHTRKNQQHPNGAIIEREGTVHLSNLMLVERFDARAAKRGETQPAKA